MSCYAKPQLSLRMSPYLLICLQLRFEQELSSSSSSELSRMKPEKLLTTKRSALLNEGFRCSLIEPELSKFSEAMYSLILILLIVAASKGEGNVTEGSKFL